MYVRIFCLLLISYNVIGERKKNVGSAMATWFDPRHLVVGAEARRHSAKQVEPRRSARATARAHLLILFVSLDL